MAACVATANSPISLSGIKPKPKPFAHSTHFFPKTPRIVLSNGFAGTGRTNYSSPSSIPSSNTSSKLYRRLDSCLVIPPPRGRKPKAIIKFLGGAFIGAVPEVTYSYLLELLASEGYLIICVPYNVTFDHSQISRRVFESNGALLQALIGSYFSEKIPKANVIISYNNRPASEAVPYFEQLGPVVGQLLPVVETSPMYSAVQTASGNAWKMLLDAAETVVPNYDPEAVVSLTKFADQLPSVFNELAQGIAEFKPTPSENLECFKESYSVPCTLLVKFDFDAIDETDRLEEILKPRVESYGGKLEKVVLSGNHITPCIQEPRWEVGNVYTPADAIAQGIKSVSLNDTRRLGRIIANWFDRLAQ
nr:uncharacterized protein LOC109153229 [Ipomoea batatas]